MLRSARISLFAALATVIASGAFAQDITTLYKSNVGSGTKKLGAATYGDPVFAQLNTYNDSAPARAGLTASYNANKGEFQYRVWPQRADGQEPTAEDISAVSFTGEPADLGLDGEVGSMVLSVDSREQRHAISFEGTYENPVLFLQMMTAGDPASAQPVFVESDGALVSVAEGANYDGARNTNNVVLFWAVFEAGQYELADGRIAIIGATDASTSSYDMADGVTINPVYSDVRYDFATDAAVIAQVQRSSGNVWQSVRIERSNSTGSADIWEDGEFVTQDVDFLDHFTMRHTRDAEVEQADEPAATLGSIGYMVIGERSWTYQMTPGDPVADPYQVASGSSSFDVALPPAMIRALGSDPRFFDDPRSFDSTEDGLSVVRVSAVALQGANGQYARRTDDMVTVDASIEDATVFFRYLFSDGTSAIFEDGSTTEHLTVSGATLTLNDDEDGVDREGRFGVIEHADSTTSLHTWYGHYVSMETDGSLSAGATDVGDNEKFTLVDMGQLAMASTPTLRLQSADMDGDDDEEVVLIAIQEDGTGYMIMDPLGIADTMYKAGYEPDDDFIGMLSATQLASLFAQLDGVDGIDGSDDITGTILKNIVDTMDINTLTRSYFAWEVEAVLEGSAFQAETSHDDGLYGATVAVGEYTLMVESNEFGAGFEVGANVVSVEGTIGGVLTASASAGVTVSATFDVRHNGFALGGGVELVSVTVMIGDADGSYASVSAGVGLGFYIAGAWGQDDQYGFTLDLPIAPVAVAVYVKGEDVEWVANEAFNWTIEAYDDVSTVAGDAWGSVSDWAQNAGGDIRGGVENRYDEARVAFVKLGNSAVTLAESAEESFINLLEDFGADAGDFFDDLGDGLTNGFNTVVDFIGDLFGWL